MLGPNTNAPLELLTSDMLLCAGEDPTELEEILREQLGSATRTFSYRCFRFWRFRELGIVWTGIGTGCLEPLLYEILFPKIVRRMGLFGTAGALDSFSHPLGTACFIKEAYALGTALDSTSLEAPLCPRLNSIRKRQLSTATIVSTDFYYLSSPRYIETCRRELGEAYAARLEQHLASTELIDMETAQFFYLARLLGGENLTDYFAVKGASNGIEKQAEQVDRSGDVLRASLAMCLEFLQIE